MCKILLDLENSMDSKRRFGLWEKLVHVNSCTICILKQSIILWKHHVHLLSQSFRSMSSDLHQRIISTNEGPTLGIEGFAIVNLRGVSTRLYFDRKSPCRHARNL